MLKTEQIGERIRTYSDEGMMIRQVETGILYIDAVDVPNKYTYEETDVQIPQEPIDLENATLEDTVRFAIGDKLMMVPPQVQPDYFGENEKEPDYFNEEEQE